MQIERVTLRDHDMSASLLNYGAITQSWVLGETPLILGYENPQDYLSDPFYLGAIVGRVANRIGGARFRLEDVENLLDANEGANSLHGGFHALSRQYWQIKQSNANQAVMYYASPDGECGFPGLVAFEVRVTLKYPRLTYEITAKPDRPTPISIAQHNYYTLGNLGGMTDAHLRIMSDRILDTDAQGVANGPIHQVKGSTRDFTAARPIGDCAEGLDSFFVFNAKRSTNEPVAELVAESGLTLRVYSDQPGAQVYSAVQMSFPFWDSAGLCIEPSGYPNAVNTPSFPSVLYSPEKPYYQKLVLEIVEDRV
ncbi:aldose epimerase family protein [Ruegeria sp. HKCCA6707]|uniref:aldose epimerase family protein n=1 Tax=unclassified Ruegeria TaxID=2625375 RepID=UPI001489C6C9